MDGSKKQKGSRKPLLLKENPSNYFKKKTRKITSMYIGKKYMQAQKRNMKYKKLTIGIKK
jgi:hypothetical protein